MQSVINNTEASRYQMDAEGKLAIADYRLRGNTLTITHVGVPRELEGRGLAKRLMDGVVADAKARGLTIDPVCPYAAAYMKRLKEG